MNKLARNWSPQQQAFIDWCMNSTGSCVLEAVAGSGKTTTILYAATQIRGSVAMLAYNKKIGDELKFRLKEAGVDWKKALAGTVHSFGLSAWKRLHPKVVVDAYKLRDMIEQAGLSDTYKAHHNTIIKLVSLAKQSAFGIVGHGIDDVDAYVELADHFDIFDNEDEVMQADLIALAIKFFHSSIKVVDTIDFEDMIYLPLFYKAPFWQYDNVFVDEAQDTNALRRALVRAILKKGGRVVAVGDRHQAIYGFTGADADSLDLIRQDHNAIQLPLTTTYRCPQSIVKFAQQWVSHIHCGDGAPEGIVTEMDYPTFLKQTSLRGESAVLCRLTAPLVTLALSCIRNKIACKIEGRDIAAKITKTLKRWKVKGLDALETKLDIWFERERTKFLAKKQEQRVQEIEDLVDTCKVLISACREQGIYDVAGVVAYTEALFGDDIQNILTLSTIHKSKGREWKRVFWLDRKGTCPSPWARQAWQAEQERNLMYVAATRAMHELCNLSVPPKGV